ncbi:T9SS type B sorting domain-containing protein [Xanthomarina spongicola]|uniref:Gliding motility-associated-like protein n=1 Tax=Xanthomarina spongicola TaxID=570520 RepID=A0A316DNI6_9FLAO|nr:T9SS type B sorting domain-containing protein [Xanthomarina spongicola]PWK19614.1 gliding motility-associated-like protein [Xanthomarina spongicola]
MKKPTFFKISILVMLLVMSLQSFSQNLVPFAPRYDDAIKGDMLLIGNSNVGLHVSDPYNGTGTNDQINAAVYVDIDGDSSTFNSSSADLDVPSDESCYQIVYAGLYWSAVVNGAEPISEVKFKVPGGTYLDITGTEIYYQNAANNVYSNSYAYYHDVTSILTALPNPEGTYSVANISTLVGPKPNSEGLSAGWSLFVIYEDPLLPSKYITSFDGFTKITSSINETIPISGFNTIPVGPVRAKYAFSTIEGDRQYTGDYLRLNGTTINATNNAGTIIRPGNNFFNSTVSIIDPATNTPEIFMDRNPSSSNTLGFDAGIINIPNPGNSLIANGATSASISLGSNLDIYYFYFSAFAIEIIAPNIVLTKIVQDDLGNDIGGQTVTLGQPLNYIIGFQNTGNDDTTNFQIRDILPINIIFNYPTDLILPTGVTVASYNPATREIIFDIEDYLVEENDPVYEIIIHAQVVDSCNALDDACSNIINNQAFATYEGVTNPDYIITDDPSVNSNTGCLITPQTTNFLVGLDCDFTENVILCGDSVQLTAANGYDSYSWSTSPTGTPVIGTTQTITVTAVGTYYVHNTALAPCQSIDQVFIVTNYGGTTLTNPVIPYADEVVTCPNDGKLLPNIFLCGANDFTLIETGITDATSIIWEQLDEGSCAPVTDTDCANENAACTWNQVGTGPNFNANTSGQFRLTLNYEGGCFSQFYFNVYQNVLNPTVTSSDIICNTPGQITVGGVPSGYEYSIDGVNFQTSNTFVVTAPGTYTVYIRQLGVPTNPCVFSVPDVQIRDRDFTASINVTQPLCYGDKGSISLAANDVEPQYFFSIYIGSTLVNSIGPITTNNYTFTNLNPGIYTTIVETEDGCIHTEDVEIIEPTLLTATSALTSPLTCTDGEITVYANGGTPPYFYFVNSTTVFQTVPEIVVTAPGVYNIIVMDSNNCEATTSITVDASLAPEFNVTQTNILCAGSASGSITVNVTNPNGNSLLYSIDGGVTFVSSNVFTGLTAGNYDVVVQYTTGPDVCLTTPQTIMIVENTPLAGTATLTTPYTCTTNGVITVSGVTGGLPPYSYSIDGVTFQSGTTFSGLTSGTYTIIIQDASGCTFIANSITIDPLNPPTDLTFSNTPLSCPLNTSTITITGTTGGFGILEYQIIAPASEVTPSQTSNVFPDLPPGTYTFQVIDENDCTYTESYTIDPLPVLTVSTIVTKDLDCTASPDVVITGTISGGTPPFTYEVSINGGAYSNLGATGSPFTYTTATSGTFQFQITDSLGCTAESAVNTIDVLTLPEIISVIQTQQILCPGDSNAAIQVTINTTVGEPVYVINVYNNTTGVDYGTQTSGLSAGSYTITLTDGNSCTDTETIIIAEPDPIIVNYHTVDITCSGSGVSQGSVIVDGVTGGTAPYNYFVTGTNGYSNSELNTTGSTSVSFDVVDFGLYQINVVDANGCSLLIQDVLVASPPDDLDINITAITDCLSGGEAVVTIGTTLISPGPFYFSIYPATGTPPGGSWIPESTPGSATFSNLTTGVTYTFIVYDVSTGCSYYETATSPIPTNSTLTLDAVTSNNITCTGSADGNVSFTVNSVYATATNITYEIFDSFTLVTTGVTGSGIVPAGGSLTVTDLGPLPFGNYYVLISETSGSNSGCSIVTVPFNITESAIALNLSVSVDQNANCNANSGVISAIGHDGTAPYLYQITTTPSAPLATDPSWASASTFNMDAGNYYVHVVDAYGCVVSSPVVVLPMDPSPVISATVNNQCTAVEGAFEIDVTLATVGMPPYSYSINGGAFQMLTAPFTITNLTSGTHTIEVQDVNGCGNLVTVDIEPILGVVPNVTTVPTCNDDDGEITVTGSGGTGSYTYSISPNPASISLAGNIFSGVPSGLYTITITDTATLCTEDATIFLQAALPPTFTTTPTAVTCFGDNTGTFEINVSGYSGTYNYEVFDSLGTLVLGPIAANTSTNPEIVYGMQAGSYSVVITETASPFCDATSSVIISSPSTALTVVALETSNVTCTDNLGTITATASGGWGTYQYELTGTSSVAYSPNGTFENLSAGVYTVNVMDSGGCIASDTVTLLVPPPINATVTPSATLLSCFGDTNATITVTATSGGLGSDYLYTLNMISPTTSSSGPQSSPVFGGLGVGTYQVVVTDPYSCSFTSADIVITQPTQIQASLVKETSQTCLTEATLTLSATGGTGPYTYSDNITFTPVLGSFATSTTFPVPVGTYEYYVQDANGCIAIVSNQITIDPLPALTLDLSLTNATINCAGDTTGVVVASALGGLGNYVYTLQDTLGNTIPATQITPGVFTELPAGSYQVQVVSGDCITTSAPFTITEPSAPLIAPFTITDVTCYGANDGSVVINASGGTGIIKYAISPQLDQFFDTNVFENLEPGNYDVIVQDELGCYLILNFTISEPTPVIITIVSSSIIPEVCEGDMDGEFSIDISGGTPPYSVSLDNYSGPYTTGAPGQTQFDFTGLGGGDHMVYVRDSFGCESEWNITFPESVRINPIVTIEYACVNNLPSNIVTVTVDDSITNLDDLDYSLDGGPYQLSNVFTNVAPGTGHYIDVRHTNGCIQRTELFDITTFDPLTLAINDGEINEIIAIASGGSGEYEFTFNGEYYGTTNVFIISESGEYTVTVTDSNGCTATATRYFTYVDVCIPNYFTPNGDGVLDGWAPGCTIHYPNLDFDIYDRYGRKVATLRIGETWDGLYQGKELPTGDYWYVVRLNDPDDNRSFVGHFTLYR